MLELQIKYRLYFYTLCFVRDLVFYTNRDSSNNIQVHPYHLWNGGGNACKTIAADISMKFIVFRDLR